MVALCAGHDLTIQLRGCKASVTLLRCTILVKINQAKITTLARILRKNQAK